MMWTSQPLPTNRDRIDHQKWNDETTPREKLVGQLIVMFVILLAILLRSM